MAGRSSEERMAGRSSEERMAGWRSEEERMAGWRSEERMAGQRLLPKAITLTDTAYLHDLHVCCQISTPNIVFKYLRKLCVYVSLRAEVGTINNNKQSCIANTTSHEYTSQCLVSVCSCFLELK